MIYSASLQFKSFLFHFGLNFGTEKQLLTAIAKCKDESEVYKLFQKNEEEYTPKLLLNSLKKVNQLPRKVATHGLEEAKQQFMGEVIENYHQMPMSDKWKFYAQVAKKRTFKQDVKQLGQELTCQTIKQIAVLLWGYKKNDIKKPRLAMRLVDQLQLNLEKLQIIQEQQKTPKTQVDEYSSEESDIEDLNLEEQMELNQLSHYNYKYKDLVLIVWALQEIKLDMSELLRYIFRIGIKNIENKELIKTKSLILLLQSTTHYKLSKEISLYQSQIIEHLGTLDLSTESILMQVQYIQTLANLQKGNEQAINIVNSIFKRQKGEEFLSSKFGSLLLWALNKLNVDNVDIYNKIGLQLLKNNIFNPMDLSQSLHVFLKQSQNNPQFQQYQFFIKALVKKVMSQRMDPRSKKMVYENIEQYQPELLKLLATKK